MTKRFVVTLSGSSVYGGDISSYQSPPETPKEIVYPSLAQVWHFSYVKAGEGYTTSYPAPVFQRQVAGLTQAGVDVGAYHYYHTEYPASVQATYFYNRCMALTSGSLVLPPACDIEDTDTIHPMPIDTAANYKLALPVARKTMAGIRDYLKAVSDKFGRLPLWYCGDWYVGWMIDAQIIAGDDISWMDQYTKWIASYTKGFCYVSSRWTPTIWQYTSSGVIVPGISCYVWSATQQKYIVSGSSSDVDCNVFIGDLSQYNNWKETGAIAPPVPVITGSYIVNDVT